MKDHPPILQVGGSTSSRSPIPTPTDSNDNQSEQQDEFNGPSPIPVFPAVPSTTIPFGFSRPLASASLTIQSAARSFTEPPGFINSALPRILQPVSWERLSILMRGVFPIDSDKPLMVCTLKLASLG